jgi:hypothetical protein
MININITSHNEMLSVTEVGKKFKDLSHIVSYVDLYKEKPTDLLKGCRVLKR